MLGGARFPSFARGSQRDDQTSLTTHIWKWPHQIDHRTWFPLLGALPFTRPTPWPIRVVVSYVWTSICRIERDTYIQSQSGCFNVLGEVPKKSLASMSAEPWKSFDNLIFRIAQLQKQLPGNLTHSQRREKERKWRRHLIKSSRRARTGMW